MQVKYHSLSTYFIAICILLLHSNSYSQSFGIRAGLNYSKFLGPSTSGVAENTSLANGFHFGINYAYKFNEVLSLKGEFLYTQIGSKYNYSGESFYRVPIGTSFAFEKGNSNIEMKISNAYLTVPVTFQWQITNKWEVYGGVYGSLLIGPRGNGTLSFISYENPTRLFFRQSLIHSYNSDLARAAATNASGPAIFLDDLIVTLSRDAGAYYNYRATDKVGNLYNKYDFGLTGGVSYYLNKGFYFGIRYDYGLLDITNNKVDHDRKVYDEENSNFIFRNDFDRNVALELSFGFRF